MSVLVLILVTALSVTPVYGDAGSGEFLPDFVLGRYRLIGQQSDADNTYHGYVEIYRDGHSSTLRVKRTTAGRVVEGSAAIESAHHGDTAVLRMRFTENQVAYESTCLIQGDLDNYARLSCLLYRQDGKTRRPGLEALFIDAGQR